MGLPVMDIQMSKKPVAGLITGVNEIKFIAMKKIHDGYFVDKEYGVFQVDSTKALRYEKQPIFFYDIRSAKPIDLLMHKELDDFIDKNGLAHLIPKHVNHGSKLRGLFTKHKDEDKALTELETDESRQRSQVQDEVGRVNEELKAKNDESLKQGNGPIKIDPDDYSSFVIETLISKGLVTREEANQIKLNLVNGSITVNNFIEELERIHKIEIHKPISANAERYVNYYRTFDPAKVYAYIKGAKGLGKDIKDLGQPKIQNLIPITYIVLAIVGVAVGAVVLSNVDLGGLTKNLIPSNLFG